MGLKDEIKAERENVKKASLKKKIQYLRDYYKVHFVVLIIILVLSVITIYNNLTQKDTMLTGILLNCSDTIEEGADAKLAESFILSQQLDLQEVKMELGTALTYMTEENAYSTDSYAAVEAISARTAAGMLDFVTGDLDTLSALAYSEFFMDLSEVLTEEQLKQYEPYLLYIDLAVIERLEEIALLKDYDAEFSIPDCGKPEDMQEPVPVFIDISRSEYMEQIYATEQEQIVFAVAVNSLREKNLVRFVDFLMCE